METTIQPKACLFVAKVQGCIKGDKCQFSHDPVHVNTQYAPVYPLKHCATEGCKSVTTYDYCKECYFGNSIVESTPVNTLSSDVQSKLKNNELLEQYDCPGYKCKNKTTGRLCEECIWTEEQYGVHGYYSNQFNRR